MIATWNSRCNVILSQHGCISPSHLQYTEMEIFIFMKFSSMAVPLTHCPLQDMAVILDKYFFQAHIKDRYNFLWNWPCVNAMRPHHLWLANTSSWCCQAIRWANVDSDLCRHMESQGHADLSKCYISFAQNQCNDHAASESNQDCNIQMKIWVDVLSNFASNFHSANSIYRMLYQILLRFDRQTCLKPIFLMNRHS